jgi:hypothetical protein
MRSRQLKSADEEALLKQVMRRVPWSLPGLPLPAPSGGWLDECIFEISQTGGCANDLAMRCPSQPLASDATASRYIRPAGEKHEDSS